MRAILRFLNRLIDVTVALALMTSGLYAGYALWDDRSLISSAADVQADLLRMKPQADNDDSASFEALCALNPDVCAWITLDGTAVDFPVLQGETNLSYINTNVYGEFAMSGSIFMDVRCNRDFSDNYQLLYGHHMADHAMFGDLALYKDAAFMEENHTGTLLLPQGAYDLEIVACLLVPASDDAIFEPTLWQTDSRELLSRIPEKAVQLREDGFQKLLQEEAPRLLAMSTCSYEFTDARTVVIAVMHPTEAKHED